MLNAKPNDLKAKQTGGFPNTSGDYLTDRMLKDHYEKWQFGPCHGQAWQRVTGCKDTTAVALIALAWERMVMYKSTTQN